MLYTKSFFCKVSPRGMPYLIVNPLGSIHYNSKISIPSLYWCLGYELPRISKSRRHLLYQRRNVSTLGTPLARQSPLHRSPVPFLLLLFLLPPQTLPPSLSTPRLPPPSTLPPPSCSKFIHVYKLYFFGTDVYYPTLIFMKSWRIVVH